MATTSSLPNKGAGLVLVEYEYKYQGQDGVLVSIKPNERYILLSKTNDHWWQVQSNQGSRPFYIPAKYVKELPADFPLLLDFADPPSPEHVLLNTTAPAPVPVPVPVPIPKTLDELSGNKLKAGDEVTIRLRPDPNKAHRKTENRMSTFGVPLDFQEPSTLMLAQHSSDNPPTSVPEIRPSKMVDYNIKTNEGVVEDHRVPGKPADPNSATRTQPIPVETPVVPPHRTSSPALDCDENQESPIELEEEEEQSSKEEDSNHIYESIQDLNLDVEALTRGQENPGVGLQPAENPSSVDVSTPIYANVSGLKKPSALPISSPPTLPPERPPLLGGLASGMPTPTPTPTLNPQDGGQVSPDQEDGELFQVPSGTHPAGLTPTDMDLLSPTSSQGSTGWEQLTDEVSGKFYFYNAATGATSWTIPEPLCPTLPSGFTAGGRHDGGPPPLPEEDYPLEENDGIATATVTTNPHLIPRAHLDLSDASGAKWKLQEFPPLPQRLMGNGVREEGSMVQVKNWRHSVAEDVSEPDMMVQHAPNSNSKGPTWPQTHRRNLSDSTDRKPRRPSPEQSHLLEKAGIINKTKVAEGGKKIRKNWSQSWTVLHGGVLTFHRDPKSAPAGNTSKTSQIVPEFTAELRGASVGWASKDKSSKKNVLELKTRQGCEYLMQYDTESIITDWLKVLQEAIRQLDQDHLSEEEDDADEDRDRRRTDRNSSGASDFEQKRVRTKLRRFLQRRPTLQSVKEKGYIRDNVFGCHLDTLCHREHATVPRFVVKCVRTVEKRGLDIDGIYRVSGNLAVIQKLRHKADHEEHLELEDGQWEEIHVITGALKLFLRELPEPLFPFSSFDKFIAAIQLPDYNLRVSYMRDLVRSLPLPNHDTMELLFRHLRRVTEHKDSNRMSVQSIAIVFGPTLLRPQTESANMTVHMVFQSQIVELMLNEFQVIFSPQ
ncbi:rho GTPase-activating protein 12 isoform X2 [Takifugu flavidus]|uniref:rho GTPase-activating protein 12 isoform X2 n=1 Tax=Takifugu flavidus TaxID=433684 RepID=UPI002544C73F|nr:rho GTPase-activating protein 12 isoform X2 [Takifugu flavidus]